MTKQWVLIALVMALALGACLSMPVMAEQMIEGSANQVETEDMAQQNRQMAMDTLDDPDAQDLTDEQITERRKASLSTANAPLAGVPLSDDAKAALDKAARQAVFEKLGMTVLPDYQSLDIAAYDEDGDARCVVSLMPLNWELATDALALGEVAFEVSDGTTGKVILSRTSAETDGIVCEIEGGESEITTQVRMLSAATPYYTVTFGGVDPQTGDAKLLGVQLFWLYDNLSEEREYSSEECQAMTEAAIGYAQDKLGLTPGEVIGSNKLSGSFETGMGFSFALEGGDSITINVSAEGHVNGYSFIPPKG